MILRRYGTTYQSVELNFDSRALSEIGFRRDHGHSEPADDFEARWEKVATHELAAEARGDVHDQVEQAALDDLEDQIRALLDELADREVLAVENEQGVDYPKTRAYQKTVVERGENRLHFTVRVDPPLRLAVYRPR